MYLIYVDESGDLYFNNLKPFVLSAFIIHEKSWNVINNKIIETKNRFFPDIFHDDVELHASDIVHRRHIFERLQHNTNYDLLKDIYNNIFEFDCDVVSVLLKKERIIHQEKDWLEWSYRFLYERLDKFLIQKNQEKSKDEADYGIMFIDETLPQFDKRIKDKLLFFIQHGTLYQRESEYLIEEPTFTSSQRNLLQMADHTAFCIRRYNLKDKTGGITDVNFEKYYKLISQKFHKNKNGVVEGCGLKTFPEK